MNYKFSYSLKQYRNPEVFIFKDKRTQWNLKEKAAYSYLQGKY